MKGVGVEPAIELSETKINFGIVGVGAAEYRDIIVSNTSKIDVKLGVKVTGAGFSLVNSDGDVLTCEFTLLAQAKENVRIVCNPAEVSSQLKGKVELVNLDIAPNQRTPLLLGSTALESIGGSFGFKIASPTDDEENEDDSEPTYDADGKLIPKVPTIYVNFTKIIMGQRVRKYFEVENCGDTMVDLVITDVSGREARNEVDFVSERSSFSFNPVAVVIKPHTKQKFAVIAKGLKMGQDTYVVHVRTRTHLEARIIPIRIKTNILSPESQLADGLKVFSRVDNSIEGLLVVKGPTEESLNSDLQLWKIYIPVIRVNLHRPSHDLQYIPTVEPNTVLPDIAPFVIRPPALPKDVPQKVRKWYSNRASMSLEQAAKSRATPGTQALDVRKQQALEFVRPVEKQVYVERTGAARRRMGGF
ncbi:hypothetical protein BC830DRAFT_520098 [Chytriomyces sp. MP71]|nr:hypothetical protein BC830DRAFT_520098 [Chytriomyces sp. MP71]